MRTEALIFALIWLFTSGLSYSSEAAQKIDLRIDSILVRSYKTPNYSLGLIESRLRQNTPIFELQLNKRVQKFITSYLIRGRSGTAQILGQASIYFPVIEAYLDQYELPNDLKYLAVIESALDPKALSEVGAAGLWQFMPATAREYGLRIDDYVDERLDLHRSTDAAMRYLSKLHTRYKDWALAIAAYNCGPAKVDRALKKAKVRNFWVLKKYLPKQTQRYVEKFIAATYAMNYYLFYDIHPKYPDYNLQMITFTSVFSRKSFRQIETLTGVPVAIIERLNPSYKKAIIPPNRDGYYLLLPSIGLNDNWADALANS